MNFAQKFLVSGSFIGFCIGGLLYSSYPGNFFFFIPLGVWVFNVRNAYKDFTSSTETGNSRSDKK